MTAKKKADKHSAMPEVNFKNRTIWEGDNLPVMRGMNGASVDLIYLDPPFNSNRTYETPIGKGAKGTTGFDDIWKLTEPQNVWLEEIRDTEPGLYHAINGTDVIHGKPMKAYLVFMGIRLLEMRRILKNTGSIYLHCDPTASHYLKTLMDAVFGRGNFRNEIVWGYKTGGVPRESGRFARKHEILLFYGKNRDKGTFNRLKEVSYIRTLPEPHTQSGKRLGVRRDNIGKHRNVAMRDWWVEYGLNRDTDIIPLYRNNKERTGYPTQKPLALLNRIISASSNKGDLVLDPFCGCATTCIAGERLGRNWAGIDLSGKTVDLLKERLEKEVIGTLTDMEGGKLLGDIVHRTDIPTRSDIGKLPSYGDLKRSLYGKQAGVCAGCRYHFRIENFEVDHITPKSQGGQDAESNRQLLCGHCNRLKGDRPMRYLVAELKKRGTLQRDI